LETCLHLFDGTKDELKINLNLSLNRYISVSLNVTINAQKPLVSVRL
jgi:Tat protein secretion system quality control protein TatD with DNase activity